MCNEMIHAATKTRTALHDMQVGDSLSFPIEKLKSIRTQCSELGAIHQRVYTTKTDRHARTIEVRRVS